MSHALPSSRAWSAPCHSSSSGYDVARNLRMAALSPVTAAAMTSGGVARRK